MADRIEVLNNIKLNEEKKLYNEIVDPVDFSLSLPVDEHFQYIKLNKKLAIKRWFEKQFIVKPFTNLVNLFHYHTKVVGKKNINGIKKAVVICNHVNMFDCLVAKKALAPHDTYITVAPFNNRKDWLGEMMRAGGILPFSTNLKAMRNLNEAIDYHLKNNHYVMFYPEQAMWWNYEKPRPFKNGAFHYALKNNVPIIPLYITFKERKSLDKNGLHKKKFVIHILKPIMLPTDEHERNVDFLRNYSMAIYQVAYEHIYHKPLKY